MIITDFTSDYVKQAEALAYMNYEEEKTVSPSIPEWTNFPDLSRLFSNGLGVCAVDEERLLGYICCYNPWEGAFDMYDSLGTFVPLYGHGAVKENRKDIYQRMYEYAAKKWAERDIKAHGISMYANDEEGIKAFFEYGFGMRCVDEIRTTEPMGDKVTEGFSFAELPIERFPEIRGLRFELNKHLRRSPCFLQNTDEETNNWLDEVEKGDRRTFVACKEGKITAYIDVAEEGENFLTAGDNIRNIQGAYCLPEFRGTGLYRDLLSYVNDVVREEGFRYLGVDHESYNPTGFRFWRKYFTPYTYSLTRRLELWAKDNN